MQWRHWPLTNLERNARIPQLGGRTCDSTRNFCNAPSQADAMLPRRPGPGALLSTSVRPPSSDSGAAQSPQWHCGKEATRTKMCTKMCTHCASQMSVASAKLGEERCTSTTPTPRPPSLSHTLCTACFQLEREWFSEGYRSGLFNLNIQATSGMYHLRAAEGGERHRLRPRLADGEASAMPAARQPPSEH